MAEGDSGYTVRRLDATTTIREPKKTISSATKYKTRKIDETTSIREPIKNENPAPYGYTITKKNGMTIKTPKGQPVLPDNSMKFFKTVGYDAKGNAIKEEVPQVVLYQTKVDQYGNVSTDYTKPITDKWGQPLYFTPDAAEAVQKKWKQEYDATVGQEERKNAFVVSGQDILNEANKKTGNAIPIEAPFTITGYDEKGKPIKEYTGLGMNTGLGFTSYELKRMYDTPQGKVTQTQTTYEKNLSRIQSELAFGIIQKAKPELLPKESEFFVIKSQEGLPINPLYEGSLVSKQDLNKLPVNVILSPEAKQTSQFSGIPDSFTLGNAMQPQISETKAFQFVGGSGIGTGFGGGSVSAVNLDEKKKPISDLQVKLYNNLLPLANNLSDATIDFSNWWEQQPIRNQAINWVNEGSSHLTSHILGTSYEPIKAQKAAEQTWIGQTTKVAASTPLSFALVPEMAVHGITIAGTLPAANPEDVRAEFRRAYYDENFRKTPLTSAIYLGEGKPGKFLKAFTSPQSVVSLGLAAAGAYQYTNWKFYNPKTGLYRNDPGLNNDFRYERPMAKVQGEEKIVISEPSAKQLSQFKEITPQGEIMPLDTTIKKYSIPEVTGIKGGKLETGNYIKTDYGSIGLKETDLSNTHIKVEIFEGQNPKYLGMYGEQGDIASFKVVGLKSGVTRVKAAQFIEGGFFSSPKVRYTEQLFNPEGGLQSYRVSYIKTTDFQYSNVISSWKANVLPVEQNPGLFTWGDFGTTKSTTGWKTIPYTPMPPMSLIKVDKKPETKIGVTKGLNTNKMMSLKETQYGSETVSKYYMGGRNRMRITQENLFDVEQRTTVTASDLKDFTKSGKLLTRESDTGIFSMKQKSSMPAKIVMGEVEPPTDYFSRLQAKYNRPTDFTILGNEPVPKHPTVRVMEKATITPRFYQTVTTTPSMSYSETYSYFKEPVAFKLGNPIGLLGFGKSYQSSYFSGLTAAKEVLVTKVPSQDLNEIQSLREVNVEIGNPSTSFGLSLTPVVSTTTGTKSVLLFATPLASQGKSKEKSLQFVQPKTIQIQQYKSPEKFDLKMESLSDLKVISLEKTEYSEVQLEKVSTVTLQKQRTSLFQKTKQSEKGQGTVTPPIVIPPVPPSPIIPPPPVIILPPIKYKMNEKPGKSVFLGEFSQKTKYSPSLIALTLNIKGKEPKGKLTGLEIRPVVIPAIKTKGKGKKTKTKTNRWL